MPSLFEEQNLWCGFGNMIEQLMYKKQKQKAENRKKWEGSVN